MKDRCAFPQSEDFSHAPAGLQPTSVDLASGVLVALTARSHAVDELRVDRYPRQ